MYPTIEQLSTVTLPCPYCRTDLSVKPEAKQVTCPECRTTHDVDCDCDNGKAETRLFPIEAHKLDSGTRVAINILLDSANGCDQSAAKLAPECPLHNWYEGRSSGIRAAIVTVIRSKNRN